MPNSVDHYLEVGCERCEFGGTPQCKVHSWQEILIALRSVMLDCGLEETIKWGVPCYMHKGKNVLLLTAFKNFAAVNFFKGSLIRDEEGLLEKPGDNSQAGRFFKFTHSNQVFEYENALRTFVFDAIDIEDSGLKVEFKKNPEPIPDELQAKLDEIPELNSAFESLTPGKKRGYIIYISGAKQSKTRSSRVLKCIPKILEGRGFHDR